MAQEPAPPDALVDLARTALRTSDATEILRCATATVRSLLGADWVTATVGASELPVAVDGVVAQTPATRSIVIDATGSALTAGWAGAAAAPEVPLELVGAIAGVVGDALRRARHDTEVAGTVERLAEAQELARLGSYDWNIVTDTNDWSDELYRIYGHEPGSFNASYERFLSMVHPDDRDMIIATHSAALEGGDVYRMTERIIRPDGEVRYLDSSGKVIRDETGRPVRMAGICLDVTDQRRADERFRALVEASPDAVLLVDGDGRILQANRGAEALLGMDVAAAPGVSVTGVVPDWADHVAVASGAGQLGPVETTARHVDGSAVTVDMNLTHLELDRGGAWAAFLRDAAPRLRTAEADRHLTQVAERQRQALELNDNVVQGLTTALYALHAGLTNEALVALEATLRAASSMMGDLLGDQVEPSHLVRAEPAPSYLRLGATPPPAAQDEPARLRVLVVDDCEDLRELYRLMLENIGAELVGEAATGEDALAIAAEVAPDVALVDLAMPGLDGLQTTSALKQLVPECRVAVLSGFGESTAAAGALAAGADRYLVKGIDSAGLAGVFHELVPTWTPATTAAGSPAPDPEARTADLLHELRTPVSAIRGFLDVLDGQIPQTAPVIDLMERLKRNARDLHALVAPRNGGAAPVAERLDPGALVRAVVADLAPALAGHSVCLELAAGLAVDAPALQLRQILVNLLTNAAKFGEPGTPITVRLAPVDGRVDLAVTNVGPPITAEDRARIFGRYERGGEANGDGEGLGLHIARSLASGLGGSLDLADPVPGEVTFVVRLPGAAPGG